MCVICDPSRRGLFRLALGAAAGLAAPSALRAVPAKKPLIMLDPGHGGHDPGAIASDGVFEKTLTLAAGLDLRHALLRTGRYRVMMTRTRDVYVTLEGRVADTIRAGANLFLSLHCDHLPENKLRGASIFTLSNTASDKLAARVAADENSADTDHSPIAGVSPRVANILASLETRATKLGSNSLAEDIRTSFQGVVPMLPDPHRSANFAVLRDPSTPAALLEMGCLSNPLDEKRLHSPRHRRELAENLTRAIDSYFANYAGHHMAG